MIDITKFKNIPEDDYEFIKTLKKGIVVDNEESVEAACLAAYLFFVSKDHDQLMKTLNVICQIAYDGNYDFWTWIEYCLALRSYTLEKNTDFVNSVKTAIMDGNNLQKEAKNSVHNRFLKGATLENISHEIKISIQNKDSEEEFSGRVEFLMEAIKLHALGGGKVGLNELEKEINIQTSEINRKFIKVSQL